MKNPFVFLAIILSFFSINASSGIAALSPIHNGATTIYSDTFDPGDIADYSNLFGSTSILDGKLVFSSGAEIITNMLYEQIFYNLGRSYDIINISYSLTCKNLPWNSPLSYFSVYLDAPEVRRINIDYMGNITGDDIGNMGVIPTNTEYSFALQANIPNNTLSIFVNDAEYTTHLSSSPLGTSVNSLRFNLATSLLADGDNAPYVELGEILISGKNAVPVPSPFLLLSGGMAVLTGIRRGSK